MGCVHMHWEILTIKGSNIPNCIQSAMEKIEETSQKPRKIGLIVNQTLTPGPKHDGIQAQCVSNIPLENMLEKLWWCKHSKMKF